VIRTFPKIGCESLETRVSHAKLSQCSIERRVVESKFGRGVGYIEVRVARAFSIFFPKIGCESLGQCVSRA